MTLRSLAFTGGVTNLARAAGVAGRLRIRPVDLLEFEAGVRILLPSEGAGRFEAAGALSGRLPMRLKGTDPGYAASAGTSILQPYVRASAVPDAWELASGLGFNLPAVELGAGYFIAGYGSATSSPAQGAEWRATLRLPMGDTVRLGARSAGRYAVRGGSAHVRDTGWYRGNLDLNEAGHVAGLDLLLAPDGFARDLGDVAVLRGLAFGPYADLAGSPGNPAAQITVGACATFTASLMGMLPFDLAAFAGFDQRGAPVAGLRVGRLPGSAR